MNLSNLRSVWVSINSEIGQGSERARMMMTRERKAGTETGLIRARDWEWTTLGWRRRVNRESGGDGVFFERHCAAKLTLADRVCWMDQSMVVSGRSSTIKDSMYIVIGLSKYERP